jgi:L-type amino acid transporter 9
MMNFAGALTFAELSCVVPRSGAEYSYLLEAFGSLHRFWGPLPSFVCAFINVCILNPTSSAVIILTFSEYVCHPFAHQMSCLAPESQDVVKKMIAVTGLGELNAGCDLMVWVLRVLVTSPCLRLHRRY